MVERRVSHERGRDFKLKCLQRSDRYHEGVRQALVRDGVVGIAMT